MVQKSTKEDQPTEIQIVEIKTGLADVAILGKTPLILHHGSVKQHLMPPIKPTKVEKETTLKHEPIIEWRERMIMAPDAAPTRLLFPVAAFKGSMMTAALRIPGAVKTEIAQLVWIDGERASIYGVPRVFIREVRNSDMARTPDARTRPILPEWACRLTIRYCQPMITAQAVANLLVAGGLICGVGDWRPEKGKGTFGQFEIVDISDPRYLAIMQDQGREAQDAAIANPVAYDAETLDVMMWYDAEMARRQKAGRSQKSRRVAQGDDVTGGVTATH